MTTKKEPNWKLYYSFEDIVHSRDDNQIREILAKFTEQDFLEMQIVDTLISYKMIHLLEELHKENIPLTYEDEFGANGLHTACGAGGSLECVKFLVENNILTDIHKKSTKFGDTPLTLAFSYEHDDIVNYFKKKFNVKNVSFEDLDVILDRVRSNFKRLTY